MQQVKTTILFDKLNNQKPCLLDFINEKFIGVADNTQQTIEQEFLCSSWQDVFIKFNPHIYLFMNADRQEITAAASEENCMQRYMEEVYPISLHKIADVITEQRWSSLQNLIDELLVQSSLDEFLIDKAEMIKSFLYGNRNEAEKLLRELLHTYNNSILLLFYYLKAYKELSALNQPETICVSEKENLQVETIEYFRQSNFSMPDMSQEQQLLYNEFIDTVVAKERKSNFNLWKNCLKIGYAYSLEAECAEKIYQSYSDFYIKIVKCFWGECRPIIEKLLGIYYFLEDSKLLIINTTAEEAVEKANQKRLKLYLEYCNEKKELKNTIHYAILPGVERENVNKGTLHHKRFDGNEEQIEKRFQSREAVREILNILAEKKITSFISSSGEYETKKLYLSVTEIEAWFADMEKMITKGNASYAYPCFPNFVHIPKCDAVYSVDNKNLYLDGVSVEASYIAAKIAGTNQKSFHLPKLNFIAYEEKDEKRLERNGYGIVFAPSLYETIVKCERSAAFLWGE